VAGKAREASHSSFLGFVAATKRLGGGFFRARSGGIVEKGGKPRASKASLEPLKEKEARKGVLACPVERSGRNRRG